MWEIVNQTPFAATGVFQRDLDGGEVWVVMVRGTFDVTQSGIVSVAAQQQPVQLAPVYAGEPGCSSLLHDSDLVLRKEKTDILLLGHACAPGGRARLEMYVRLMVGDIVDKTIRVVGERRWQQAALRPRLSKAAQFVTMPLTYEHAYGGRCPGDSEQLHQQNPVGTGFVSATKYRPGMAAPSLLPAEDDSRKSIGFGAISRNWQPRASYAGTFDAIWRQMRSPLLPQDFDERFFQSAPEDQQARLRGGEEVRVMGATPDGLLAFELPRVHLSCRTMFTGQRGAEPHRATLHTVTIEPTIRRVQLVWQTHLRCHANVNRLTHTVVTQKKHLW